MRWRPTDRICLCLQLDELVSALTLHMALSREFEEELGNIVGVATACLVRGLELHGNRIQLHPVLMSQVGDELSANGTPFEGKLKKTLQLPTYQELFRLVPGPGELAVLPKLSALLPVHSADISNLLSAIKVIKKHPKA